MSASAKSNVYPPQAEHQTGQACLGTSSMKVEWITAYRGAAYLLRLPHRALTPHSMWAPIAHKACLPAPRQYPLKPKALRELNWHTCSNQSTLTWLRSMEIE